MSARPTRRTILPALAAALLLAAPPASARAGKMGWLDEVVQGVVREADAAGRVAGKPGARLFAAPAEQGLESLARGSDELARLAGRGTAGVGEAALEARFARLLKSDPQAARVFAELAPAEKRLVVEVAEAAAEVSRRFPGRGEAMVRGLGPEGLAAVRVYGPGVAEVIAKEGPASIDVLRKSGRGGWRFFTEQVLPHKKKLAAAGVLALFLANPDQFVDSAGRATRYAAEQFARAGVQLAGAVAGGTADGLAGGVDSWLAPLGLHRGPLRWLIMGVVGLVAILSLLALIGVPVRWMLRPITWPLRAAFGRRARAA